MNTKELKSIIKPLIKECIKEVLLEEGLAKLISESKQPPAIEKVKPSTQVNEQRKRMLDEIGKSGYVNNKFDPFSGTKPLTESQASNTGPNTGPLKDIDPSDPGVDISKLMNGNKKIWNALMGGKAK
jgi:hypothetical protein